MVIKKDSSPTGQTFYLQGRFDAHQVPKLKQELGEIENNLCLDLKHVNFIDSTGLALLVSLYKQANTQGLDFQLLNVQDSVRIIFEITQLHTILPFQSA